MAVNRTRKNKANPNYQFLVSWEPNYARVKGESNSNSNSINFKAKGPKKADILAQEAVTRSTKKDIFKSLILVSLILALEVVVYLAWSRFQGSLLR